MNNFKEKAMKIVFLLTASFSILAVALICVFLFANGNTGNQRNRIAGFSARYKMETGK